MSKNMNIIFVSILLLFIRNEQFKYMFYIIDVVVKKC